MGSTHVGTEGDTLTFDSATVGLAASKNPFLCIIFQQKLTPAGKKLIDSVAQFDPFVLT